MDIELRTHDPECRMALMDVQDQGGAAGYAAHVEVASRGFSARQLVGFRTADLARFAEAVAAMDATLRGAAWLQAANEAHYLALAVGPTGAVTVQGELHDYRQPEQVLRFAFHTDQTCLGPLARELQAALASRAI